MIAGRYSLDREVGRGGMGTVWLGRDEVLGRAVALKRIGMFPGAGGPDLVRAEREARLAARLNHPHVVAVFDLVIEEDHQWLVMEYVEHSTLAGLVRDGGALPPDRAAPLLAQAADALAAAHAAGIVHRDVKPSNILVTRQGQVKLTDFGIARATADASLTQTGLVTGSPAYLAPEVASGQGATAASDVWSLGATLYHALAGEPPYDVNGNLMGALYRIVHEDPPRLPAAGWLAPVLEATMTRDPAQRWPMSAVRDALQAGPPARPSTVRLPTGPEPSERTQLLPSKPPPAPPGPAPRAAPGDAEPSPARRRTVLPVVLGLAGLVAVGVVAWAALAGGDDGSSTGAEPRPGAATSHSSSPTTTAAPGPTVPGMQAFIEDYLAAVTSDPRSAFAMLTPRFQQASGGYGGYEGFWGTIRSARLSSFTSTDPEALTVGYTVDYTRRDGSTATDQVSLQLAYRNGRYLIEGEA